jgi:hypothetical protein
MRVISNKKFLCAYRGYTDCAHGGCHNHCVGVLYINFSFAPNSWTVPVHTAVVTTTACGYSFAPTISNRQFNQMVTSATRAVETSICIALNSCTRQLTAVRARSINAISHFIKAGVECTAQYDALDSQVISNFHAGAIITTCAEKEGKGKPSMVNRL